MWKRKILALVLAVTAVLALALPGAAAETLGSITLKLSYQGQIVQGDEMLLYQVADRSGKLTKDFAPSGAKDLESQESAASLARFALEKKLTPLDRKRTDARGELKFAPLPEGIYLIAQGDSKVEYRSIRPFFAPMPLGDEDQEQVYHYVAKPKMEEDCRPQYTEITVEKVWKDEKGNILKPSDDMKVTVELLKNGVKHDSTVLNHKNNWTYTWENLEARSDWSVREEPVKDYTVKITQVGNKFIIENQKKSDQPPKPTTPGGSGGGGGGKPPLIQTGQLNWPIPLLALGGILLFAAGWALTFLKDKKRK